MSRHFTYVLFSEMLNRFYVGSTSIDPHDRLSRHLEQYYGNRKFTASTKDWIIFLEIECDTKNQALSIESHIKRMKSRKYILNLRSYPEILLRLKEKYK